MSADLTPEPAVLTLDELLAPLDIPPAPDWRPWPEYDACVPYGPGEQADLMARWWEEACGSVYDKTRGEPGWLTGTAWPPAAEVPDDLDPLPAQPRFTPAATAPPAEARRPRWRRARGGEPEMPRDHAGVWQPPKGTGRHVSTTGPMAVQQADEPPVPGPAGPDVTREQDGPGPSGQDQQVRGPGAHDRMGAGRQEADFSPAPAPRPGDDDPAAAAVQAEAQKSLRRAPGVDPADLEVLARPGDGRQPEPVPHDETAEMTAVMNIPEERQ